MTICEQNPNKIQRFPLDFPGWTNRRFRAMIYSQRSWKGVNTPFQPADRRSAEAQGAYAFPMKFTTESRIRGPQRGIPALC